MQHWLQLQLASTQQPGANTPDIFVQLSSDHNEQRGLLTQLEALAVTEAHLIQGLLHQLAEAESSHTFAEATLKPMLIEKLGDAGQRLQAAFDADDAAIATLMATLRAASPERDFIAFKAALAKLAERLREHLSREQACFPELASKLSPPENQQAFNNFMAAKQRAPAPTVLDAMKDSAKGFVNTASSLFSKIMPSAAK